MIDEDGQKGGAGRAGSGRLRAADRETDWTRSLKRLYNSVLEEPLPQNFKDLLSKLDDDTRGR